MAINTGHASVKACPALRFDVGRFDADTRDAESFVVGEEVGPSVIQLDGGAGRFLEKENAAPGVTGKKKVAFVTKFAVGDETVFEYKVIVPVRRIPEFDSLAVPMGPGYGEAVQDSPLDGPGGHVGGGFDVLPVCGIVRAAVDLPFKGAADGRVAADRRHILEDAVIPADLDGALRKADPDQEMRRPQGRFGNLGDFQFSP